MPDNELETLLDRARELLAGFDLRHGTKQLARASGQYLDQVRGYRMGAPPAPSVRRHSGKRRPSTWGDRRRGAFEAPLVIGVSECRPTVPPCTGRRIDDHFSFVRIPGSRRPRVA